MKYNVTDRDIQQLFRRAKYFDELLEQDSDADQRRRYLDMYNGLAMAISILNLEDEYEAYEEFLKSKA